MWEGIDRMPLALADPEAALDWAGSVESAHRLDESIEFAFERDAPAVGAVAAAGSVASQVETDHSSLGVREDQEHLKGRDHL